MERFNLKKHWDGFIQGKIAVNCESEELAKEFLKYCDNKNLRWAGGCISLLNNTYWSSYKLNTAYWCKNKISLGFAPISYFHIEEEAGVEIIVIFKGFGNKTKGDSEMINISQEEKIIRKSIEDKAKDFRGTQKEINEYKNSLIKEAKLEYEKQKKINDLLSQGMNDLGLNLINFKVDGNNIKTTVVDNCKNEGRAIKSKSDEADMVIGLAVAYFYSKFPSKTQADKFAKEVYKIAIKNGGKFKY